MPREFDVGRISSPCPTHLSCRNHEGYVITKPREFFEKYSPYLRATLPIVCQALRAGNYMMPGINIAANILEQIVLPDNGTLRLKQLVNAADTLVKKISDE